jgi:hypothetical protein
MLTVAQRTDLVRCPHCRRITILSRRRAVWPARGERVPPLSWIRLRLHDALFSRWACECEAGRPTAVGASGRRCRGAEVRPGLGASGRRYRA